MKWNVRYMDTITKLMKWESYDFEQFSTKTLDNERIIYLHVVDTGHKQAEKIFITMTKY
jgi:hypothetical protein